MTYVSWEGAFSVRSILDTRWRVPSARVDFWCSFINLLVAVSQSGSLLTDVCCDHEQRLCVTAQTKWFPNSPFSSRLSPFFRSFVFFRSNVVSRPLERKQLQLKQMPFQFYSQASLTHLPYFDSLYHRLSQNWCHLFHHIYHENWYLFRNNFIKCLLCLLKMPLLPLHVICVIIDRDIIGMLLENLKKNNHCAKM